jgi:hypothetical protein
MISNNVEIVKDLHLPLVKKETVSQLHLENIKNGMLINLAESLELKKWKLKSLPEDPLLVPLMPHKNLKNILEESSLKN